LQRLLTISEVARKLGCSVEWLREAEAIGRIPAAKRDINGWRRYVPEDVKEIKRRLFPSEKETCS